ncbi:MAG: metallophosphoesterase [Clostridia bacterium]|nr:metallophosphoesterase [Clostridia bacterium]
MRDISYLTDNYDEKIAEINKFDAPLNFVFITDQHNRMNEFSVAENRVPGMTEFEYAVDAINSIQYILDRCPKISMVINGGDMGNDYNPDPQEIIKSHKEVMEALYNLSVPVHTCIGNHDNALGPCTDEGRDNRDYVILPERMHELCMKYNPTPDNYYYIDLEEQNFRFVFLDVSDGRYNQDKNGQYQGWMYEISNKQAAWFETEALNTDRKIIVFCHGPVSNKGIYGTENYPQGIKPYDDLINGPRVHYAMVNNKNVVCHIAGHVHYDNLLYDDGILTVTTQSSLAWAWCPACPERKCKAITETAFDVFSIKDNVVKITRFGAGEDRVGCLQRL